MSRQAQIIGDYSPQHANYDATELAVRRGDVVQVAEVRHGWMLVANADGARGWIPAACTAPE